MSPTNPPTTPDDATTPLPPTATYRPQEAVVEGGPDVGAPADERGPRTGTLVGALVLILLGVGVAAVGLGARLDLQAALIALLVIAGAALLVGALLSARRNR